MKCKLFPNIKQLTLFFWIGIACMTLSVLTLRLTVFSDMAAVPEPMASDILLNEKDGYQINSKVYFAASDAKGDVFIANMEANPYNIKVDITLVGSGDSILSTSFIKPGDTREHLRMNPSGQKLQSGVYDCIAEISAHNPTDLKRVGSVQVPIQVAIGEKPSTK